MAKKKILMLSDDLRMHSGVACVSKDIVSTTLHHYDWVQIGGAIQHPEEGKMADMSQLMQQETGVQDAYLRIYPVSGYGNPDLLREVMAIEKPDAILHYTDPRFWLWLYQMEHEVRTQIPIFYNNIWDDLPDPLWNENFYRSCDLLIAISKQTYGINKRMLPDYEDWQIKYVPHGINEKRFFPVNRSSTEFLDFMKHYELDRYKFKVLYSNRNIRRKMPGDVVLAFKHMVDQLPEKQRKDCALVFHTQVSDDNGTDLREVCRTMMPEYRAIFTYDRGGPFDDKAMNYLFNACDVYINLASNEGFGLGSCEALTVGVPIVINVTGGLQDQCGFKNGDEYLTAEDYIELGSNHRGEYTDHGPWVRPAWPKTISLLGSPPTPYIFDDRCTWEDAGDALLEWYDMGPEERERNGELGRKFVNDNVSGMTAQHMGDGFIESMDGAFENWKPKERFTLEQING
jgi:glycosyltransferase involved in cell wall biosynthesis